MNTIICKECGDEVMTRWLLKSKQDFAIWRASFGCRPKSDDKQLDEVRCPDIYPNVIIWYWYHDAEGIHRFVYTFVMPRDFEYSVDK